MAVDDQIERMVAVRDGVELAMAAWLEDNGEDVLATIAAAARAAARPAAGPPDVAVAGLRSGGSASTEPGRRPRPVGRFECDAVDDLPAPPADSPAGRIAWSEARLRELCGAIEAGRPATGPEVRAVANQLRAALAEVGEPDSPAGRAARAGARLAEIAAALEGGAHAAGSEVRAVVGRLVAALEELGAL